MWTRFLGQSNHTFDIYLHGSLIEAPALFTRIFSLPNFSKVSPISLSCPELVVISAETIKKFDSEIPASKSACLDFSKRSKLRPVTPNDLNVVVANLTDSKGLDDIVNSTLTKFGKIDILINNAGANISDGTLNTDQSIELYQKTFQINFQAVVEMIKKTKEHLIKTKGEIVNVSSIAGNEQAFSATPYYCAAKSALNQYTRCIALDLIQYGVRVNSVSPGVVVTGFLGAMGLPDEFRDKMANFMASNKACIPAGFCAKPNDIAEIILFLSDRKKSQYIVGQSIVADGGTSLVTGMTAFDMHEMI